MKKRMIIASILLCMLFIVNVYASATYVTSRQGSSQGYKVTARAYWVYETGRSAH